MIIVIAGLDGPSREIIVEPVEQPQIPEPLPKPKKEPVPA